MAHALGGNSSSSSISLNGDDDMYSDTADPIHDDTIINELFYKHSVSQVGYTRGGKITDSGVGTLFYMSALFLCF